jgi:hypothetical protein
MFAFITDRGGTVPHKSVMCNSRPMSSTRAPPAPNETARELGPNPLGEQTPDEDVEQAYAAMKATARRPTPVTMMARLVRWDIVCSTPEGASL